MQGKPVPPPPAVSPQTTPQPASPSASVAPPVPDRGVVLSGAITKRAPPDASNVSKTNRGDAIVGTDPFVLARTKGGGQAWIRSVEIRDAKGQQREVLQVVESDGKVREFSGDAKSTASLQEQFQTQYKIVNPVR
jgi:hypothetical protein